MMLRALTVLLLLAIALAARAQTFEEYLKQRKKYGIAQASGIPALEAFIGKRTLEVSGTVKGTMRIGERQVIMLDRGDGKTIDVQSDKVPDWLVGNEVVARMIIRAERDTEMGELRTWLVAAASESQVASYEAAEAKRNAPKPKTLKATTKPPPKTPGREWNLPPSEATPHYAAFIKKRNPRLSQAEANRIAEGIIGFSIMYGVDARLIMAMVMAESGFNPNATSRAGAMGLGQLMPGTARGLGVNNAYDSIENLYGTVRTVRGHLERYGKKTGDSFEALVLMLAAYNSGSGTVRRYNGVPPYKETQNYIRKVISFYRAFCDER